MIMASTLWVASIVGDDRLTVGAVLIAAWVLPILIRRMRRGSASAQPARAQPRLSLATASPSGSLEATASSTDAPSARMARKPATMHNGRRRRPSRGLHR
jgi:hypothetical protein